MNPYLVVTSGIGTYTLGNWIGSAAAGLVIATTFPSGTYQQAYSG